MNISLSTVISIVLFVLMVSRCSFSQRSNISSSCCWSSTIPRSTKKSPIRKSLPGFDVGNIETAEILRPVALLAQALVEKQAQGADLIRASVTVACDKGPSMVLSRQVTVIISLLVEYQTLTHVAFARFNGACSLLQSDAVI